MDLRSPPKIPKPWLDEKTKIVGAVLITFAFVLTATAFILIAIFVVPKMSGSAPEDYFPDISVETACSTCWEATVFATSSDPFYQWVTRSSIAQDLNVSGRGKTAYQRLSTWRVVSNKTKDGAVLYNSPDPHILGGNFVKHGKSRVLKMTVNWGMSVRLCLTLPGSLEEPCLFTTPIVSIDAGSRHVYAALLVGVPYRKASSNPFGTSSSDLYIGDGGHYLTNFVSNARTAPGLKLKSVREEEHQRYVYNGKACDSTSPIYFTPDVVAYLGFPSLQCGCVAQACFIGLNISESQEMKDEYFGMKLNTSGCRTGKSFWNYDAFNLKDNRTVFYTYTPKWNASVTLQMELKTSLYKAIVFPSGYTISNVASCVEAWLETQNAMPAEDTLYKDLLQACGSSLVANMTAPPSYKVTERYRTRAALRAVQNTFTYKIPAANFTDNEFCGIDEGQVKLADNLCTMDLAELKYGKEMQILEKRLTDFAKVVDIQKFVDKEWQKGTSQRSEMLIGIVTAIVTIIVTILGMFNRELQEVEIHLLKKFGTISAFIKNTISIPLFKTLTRALILFSVVLWNMFNVFRSLQDTETEPRAATSGTLLQQLNGISFLVTTTSTVQVTSGWIMFFGACTSAFFLSVAVIFGVYTRMRYIEINNGNDKLDQEEGEPKVH